MKKLFILSILAVLPAGGFADESPFAPRPHDAVCGFCAAFRTYREEGHVKSGISVDMLVGPGQVNRPVTLRFFVNQKPSNWPDDNLEIEHEKYMHVIGVDENLQNFFHVHPIKTGPGMWAATYTFTNSGNYKIWTDIRWGDVSYTYGHPLLKVSGGPATVPCPADFRDRVTVSGYRVTLSRSDPFAAGRTNQLQFSIRDGSSNNVDLENYLGAPMHLVIVKDDLSVYLHAHPDSSILTDRAIRFSPVLASGGVYKFFAQFRPAKAKLPADEAMVAEFYVKATGNSMPGN